VAGVLTSFSSATPLATPTATPIPTPEPSPKNSLEVLIKKYFGKDWQVAYEIANKESGLNPKAINNKNKDGSMDIGLFQINSIHADYVDGDLKRLLEPEVNTAVAYKIYQKQGWCPWVAAKKLGYCQK